ncbi:MAG: hypothetical protein ACJ79R_23750, partial [Anaeromyxobacteraceae bacterium]
MTADLVVHLARFAGALRAEGVRVAMGDEEDALGALVRVDLGDRAEVRDALRCTLKITPRDAAAFEALFDALWTGRLHATPRPPSAARQGPPGPRSPWPVPPAADEREEREGSGAAEGEEPGYAREALLRKKPFDECDARD